jgi:hypothetical protein
MNTTLFGFGKEGLPLLLSRKKLNLLKTFGFEALTAVVRKSFLFCVISCSWFEVSRRFGGKSFSIKRASIKALDTVCFMLVSCLP